MSDFVLVKSKQEEGKNAKNADKKMDKLKYPLIFKEMPGTKIKKKNSVKP